MKKKRWPKYRLTKTPTEIARAIEARTLLMIVYHRGRVIDVRPVAQGFPSTPMVCPHCGETLHRDDPLYNWARRVGKARNR
jgi:hypothetical protein